MKKLPLIIALALFLSPTLAQAELQCFSSPYAAYVSVQNAAQCAAYDPAATLFDTATQSWQNPKTGSPIPNPAQTDISANDYVSQGFSAVGTTNETQQTAQTSGVNTNTFCTAGKCTYVPLEPIPGLPSSYGPNKGSFPELISSSFKLLIGAGALIAIIMIVMGALTYMFSDIVGNKKKALTRIRGAMWAIVLLVSSYLILVTINPDLVRFNLQLEVMDNFNIGSSNTTGTTGSTPTRIMVTESNGTIIYDGQNSYNQMMDLKERCKSPKTLHQQSGGTDDTGSYSVWTCN